MATIANLAVSLTARIGNFEKGFKKARKVTTKFASDLARHTKTIAGYGLALASVAAGALSFMIKKQFDFIDSTAKTAQKLGLTTEALTGLQHAAELTGVPITQLEMGIQRMTRRIAEAAKGTGEAQGALKTLGLDATKLAAMSPDKQFLTIADAMENVGNQAERVRLGFKLFDSEGVALINVLRGGSKAVQEYIDEAEALGLSFNEIESSKIEEANDAITRMKAVITGAARTLSFELAPFVTAAADKLRAMGTDGEGMGEKVVNAFHWVLKAVGKLADYFELVRTGFYVLQGAAALLGEVTIRAFTFMTKAAIGFAKGIATVAMGPAALIGPLRRLVTGGFDAIEEELTGTADSIADKLGGVWFEAVQNGRDAFTNFLEGVNSKKAEAVFNRIIVASENAKNVTSKISTDIGGMLEEVGAIKTTSFQQVDLKRVAIGGVSNPKDKAIDRRQGDTMIQRLTEIARNTSYGPVLVS